jgi:hypothetical protein
LTRRWISLAALAMVIALGLLARIGLDGRDMSDGDTFVSQSQGNLQAAAANPALPTETVPVESPTSTSTTEPTFTEVAGATTAGTSVVGATCEGQYVFRGVRANHLRINEARQGIAMPVNPNANITAKEHNAGGVPGGSQFTSWTHQIGVARNWAEMDGPGGVLLRTPTGAAPPRATWHWSQEISPDKYSEGEILMEGIRHGLEVLVP